MRSLVLCLSLLFITTPFISQAQDDITLYLTVRSYHQDRSQDYQEWNLGAGVRKNIGPFSLEIGAYRNSFNDLTTYLFGTRKYPRDSWIGLIGGLGLATGYKYKIAPVPVAGIYIGQTPGIRMGLVPDPVEYKSVIFIQIKYDF